MKTTLIIEDMECPSCTSFLEKALAGLAGVRKVGTNLKKRHLKLEYDESQVSIERILAEISQYGYHPSFAPGPGANSSPNHQEG